MNMRLTLIAESRSTSATATRRQLRTDLRASCGDGAAFGGMVGFGETYLPAFVLALGLGELTAGLVSSLPLVAGGIMQTITPVAVRRLQSHKRWVVTCATVQALSFVPLLLAAWWGTIGSLAVLGLAAIYWGAGLATGTAWNTWIGTIVPAAVRPQFFALRTRASQATVFLGFLGGGILLQYAANRDLVLPAFACLFAIAGLSRLISVWMLSRQSEPTPIPAGMRHIPLRKLVGHLNQSSSGGLLVYLIAVQAAVQMAGPFFTPFMLEKLKFSYAEYVTLISAAFLAKIFALPLWGRVAHRIGAKRLLWIGGCGIVPMSAAWILSQQFGWLMTVQIVSGTIWAAYELSFFLLFFESIAEQERTSLLTLYNLINTIAWIVGAAVGGVILYTFEASYVGYLIVFALSSAGRFLALPLLGRLSLEEVEADEIGMRTVAVRPNAAALDIPVLPSLPDQVAIERVD